MYQFPPLIYDLALMLGTAGIVVLLFQRIKQPVILGYLVAGVILGPYTPPYALINDVPNIEILSELGVIFLMFSLGLEFSFQKLTRVGFSAVFIGLVGVLSMIAIGYFAGRELNWSYYDSLFLGAALSISSTTIIVKAIDELKLKTKRFAELIVGVLIVEDLLTILLLVALSTMVATSSILSMDMVYAGVKLVIVVGGWFLIGYFIVPPLFRRFSTYISEETLTIISVALCLSLVCAAESFHYSSALGAFIMGSILAETMLGNRIERLIHPIRDIFGAVFFISVGMLIDPGMILKNWMLVLFLASLTIVGKIVTKSIAAVVSGQRVKTGIRVGFGMAPVGEFSFIIAALGATLHVTSNSLYPIIVAISGITTFVTPYLMRGSSMIADKADALIPDRTKYFLDNYAAWVVRSKASSSQQSNVNRIGVRLINNGIIVAIVFTAVHHLCVPYIKSIVTSDLTMQNLISLFLAILLSSPFIWGMLFSFKAAQLPEYAKRNWHPGYFIVWLLTLTEIVVLGLAYFHTWVTVLIFALLTSGFFLFAYRHLESSYQWFERQLVRNIHNKAKAPTKFQALAPWETHLVEISVTEKSKFVGQTLEQAQIRQRYSVNVVAINRFSRLITAPRGDERMLAHDRLIVLGDDDQIEVFKDQVQVEAEKEAVENSNLLDNFALKAVLIEPNHPDIGKTIRGSLLREKINGMVVGLERDHQRILNPHSNTLLQAGDMLLVVGDVVKIQEWVVAVSRVD